MEAQDKSRGKGDRDRDWDRNGDLWTQIQIQILISRRTAHVGGACVVYVEEEALAPFSRCRLQFVAVSVAVAVAVVPATCGSERSCFASVSAVLTTVATVWARRRTVLTERLLLPAAVAAAFPHVSPWQWRQ